MLPAAFARLAVCAVTLASVALVLSASPRGAEGALVGLPFPAPAGTSWQVAAGYNTATHSEADGGDPYALDIVRTDGPTGGTTVLSPMTGEVQYVGSSGSRCVGIRDDAGYRVMMCHLNTAPGLRRGQPITRGEPVGTVAEAGDAANNGLAHIHYALNAPGGSHGWGSGPSLPFAGEFAIEGIALAAVTTPNAYGGVRFVSTNIQNRRPTVDAGVDVYVLPGAEVVLKAVGSDRDGDPLTYVWAQTNGSAVESVANGPELRFVAGSVDGEVLTFAVTAIDPGVRYASDDVQVYVTTSPPPVNTGVGEILSGALPPQGGFGALLFGGGTTDQLLAAAGCAGNARFWVTEQGRFIAYIGGAADFVNADWNALFVSDIPARTIVIGQCA